MLTPIESETRRVLQIDTSVFVNVVDFFGLAGSLTNLQGNDVRENVTKLVKFLQDTLEEMERFDKRHGDGSYQEMCESMAYIHDLKIRV